MLLPRVFILMKSICVYLYLSVNLDCAHIDCKQTGGFQEGIRVLGHICILHSMERKMQK